MKNATILSFWIKRFLLEYIIDEKNLSRNTQHSYRDTLRLCLPFIANKTRKSIDELAIDDLSCEAVKLFLLHLESDRHCCVATRNQRLASIHSLAQFIALNNPEYIEWYRQIHLIPTKKTKQPLIAYLEKFEMDALLDAPNCNTRQGERDHAILLFLYNTGARANEVAQLNISDLDIASSTERDFSIVTIKGKGNKLRKCPLWKTTASALTELVSGRKNIERVFLNRYNQPLTRFGIHALVKRYVKKITVRLPSLKTRRISPHTIRHTTATHLLRAGVDINTIRAWLGHVSINTTNIYAEVDLETRAQALSLCDVSEKKSKKHWRDNKKLMDFLNAL